MKIGVLALQGAFVEHEKMLGNLGVSCVELRERRDIQGIDALVLPGGESTVQGKLLRELGMFGVLREEIRSGLPALATCAGMILLAEHLADDPVRHFATLPVTVRRNAYGRQLGSFTTTAPFKGIGPFTMTFIRAPIVEVVGAGVETLACVDGKTVAVRFGNQMALAFHPELERDDRIHRLFLKSVQSYGASRRSETSERQR